MFMLLSRVGAVTSVLLLAATLASCSGASKSNQGLRFEEHSLAEPAWFGEVKDSICAAAQAGPAGNVLDDTGAPEAAQQGDAPCYLTSDAAGGGAIFDFSDDGVPDLIITTSLLGPPIFLKNLGDWRFEDVSEAFMAGMDLAKANGVAIGDVDNDGKADIFFTGYARKSSMLLLNQGGGRFSEQAAVRNADMDSGQLQFGASAVFGDFDNDGWLDLHTTEYRLVELSDRSETGHARLLHNLGAKGQPGVFEDVTVASGTVMRQKNGSILAFVSAFYDVNDDGWLDLHVVSDFNASKVFINNGDGTFRDGVAEFPLTEDESGMGIAMGDVSGDGTIDVFVPAASQSPAPDPQAGTCKDIDPVAHAYGRDGTTGNRLYLLDGGTVTEATDRYGVRHGGWSWGAVMADLANKGRLDIITVASFNTDFSNLKLYCLYEKTTMPVVRIWENTGLEMTEVSQAAGVVGSGRPKSPLTADLDGDGDEDLIILNSGFMPRLFENVTGNAAQQQVRLVFSGTESPHYARITVTFTDKSAPLVRFSNLQNGLFSARYTDEIVGLGDRAAIVDEISVEYRSGLTEKIKSPSPGQRIVLP